METMRASSSFAVFPFLRWEVEVMSKGTQRERGRERFIDGYIYIGRERERLRDVYIYRLIARERKREEKTTK